MSLLDQLNLRPQERRVLVVVLFLVFVVLNWMFVRPLFGQWSVVKGDLEKARTTLRRYNDEIQKAPTYEALENRLKSSGSEVLTEELALQRIVDTQARAAGVSISRFTPGVRSSSGRTNQFFEDQGLSIDLTTGGKELVEFLVGMASGNSMVRVQEMNLRPDAMQTRLIGNILFVASYQKKAPPKLASPLAAASRPASASPAPAANAPKPKSTSPTTNALKTNITKTAAPPSKPAPTNLAKAASTNSAKPQKK